MYWSIANVALSYKQRRLGSFWGNTTKWSTVDEYGVAIPGRHAEQLKRIQHDINHFGQAAYGGINYLNLRNKQSGFGEYDKPYVKTRKTLTKKSLLKNPC